MEQENQVDIEQQEVTVTEGGEKQQERQYSRVEQQALEMGWRPQEEWSGEPDDFVSAKEFVSRKSFFDKIGQLSKKVKEQEEVLTKFAEHHQKLEQSVRKQLLDELKAKKKEALVEGDADAVIEIDDAILEFKEKEKELQAQEAAAKRAAKQTGLSPQVIVQEWQKKNTWYLQDEDLREFADATGVKFITQKQTAGEDFTPEEVLDHIERTTKKVFSAKFQNQNRKKPAAVEGSSGAKTEAGKERVTYTDEEFRLAKKMSKMMPTLYKSPEDYIREVRKIEKSEKK